jgi:hypothetical protein
MQYLDKLKHALVLVSFLFFTSHLYAQAQKIDDAFWIQLDKNTIDWTKPDSWQSGIVWNPPKSQTKDNKDPSKYKNAVVSIGSILFNGEVVNVSNSNECYLRLTTEIGKEPIDKLLRWCSDKWGKPQCTVDLSSGMMLNRSSSWTVGKSTVLLWQFGIRKEGEDDEIDYGWLQRLNIGSKDVIKPLLDLIYIKCDSESVKFDDTINTNPDNKLSNVLILDPNSKTIYFKTKAKWGEATVFTDSIIKASRDTEQASYKITIDRVTGMFEMRAYPKKDDIVKCYSWSGTCKKIGNGTPKF